MEGIAAGPEDETGGPPNVLRKLLKGWNCTGLFLPSHHGTWLAGFFSLTFPIPTSLHFSPTPTLLLLETSLQNMDLFISTSCFKNSILPIRNNSKLLSDLALSLHLILQSLNHHTEVHPVLKLHWTHHWIPSMPFRTCGHRIDCPLCQCCLPLRPALPFSSSSNYSPCATSGKMPVSPQV